MPDDGFVPDAPAADDGFVPDQAPTSAAVVPPAPAKTVEVEGQPDLSFGTTGDFTTLQPELVHLGPQHSVSFASPPNYVMTPDEADKVDRLGSIMREADVGDPHKIAAQLRLSSDSGVAPATIASDPETIKRAWEASNFDPARFRIEHPELSEMILRRPELAQVVYRDKPLNAFSKAINAVGDWLQDRTNQPPPLPPGQTGVGGSLPDNAGDQEPNATQSPGAVAAARELRDAPKRVAYVRDNKAKLLEEYSPLERAALIPLLRAGETWDQLRLSRDYAQLKALRWAGADTSAIEERVRQRELDTVQRDYQEGPVEQFLSDVATGATSSAAALERAGEVGGATGLASGAIVGLGTLAITRNPALAWEQGLETAVAMGTQGGRAGAALGTFELEGGDAYRQMLKDGMPEPTARLASDVYGVLATAIEFAGQGNELAALGPVGELIKSGDRKAFSKALLQSASFRASVRKMVAASGTEIGEEGLQDATQQAVDYFARSYTAGSFQSKGIELDQSLEAMAQAAPFAVVMPLGEHGIHRATTAIATNRAQVANAQAQVLAQLKDSPTLEAAPAAVAQAFTDATAKTGNVPTHLFVTAPEVVRYHQEQGIDVNDAMRTLMGEDGPRALQEALALGQPLAVPLEKYADKWAGKPVAEALAEHTTATPRAMTSAQLDAMDKEAERLAAENVPAETPGEARWLDTMEQQLATVQGKGKANARKAMTLMRAFVRTQSEVFGKSADELFRNLSLEVVPGDEAISVSAQRFNQDSDTIAKMKAAFNARSIKEQAQKLYGDQNTGLLNRRGRAVEKRAGSSVNFDIEGKKFINDVFGHGAFDAVLRRAAGELRGGSQEAGGLGSRFTEAGQSTAAAERMSKALQKIRVVPSTEKESSRAAGTFANRKSPPLAFLREGEHAAFTRVQEAEQAKRAPAQTDVAAVEAAKTRAAAEMKPLIDELAKTPEASAANVGEEHASDFAANVGEERAFEQIYKTPEGLLSGAGFHEAQRVNPKQHTALVDARGFGDIAREFGGEAADGIASEFSKQLAEKTDPHDDVGRLHEQGDEYAQQSNDLQRLKDNLDAFAKVLENQVFYLHRADGSVVVQEGLYFAYGLGKDLHAADDKQHTEGLPAAKDRQDRTGRVRKVRVLSAEQWRALGSAGGNQRFVDVGALVGRGRAEGKGTSESRARSKGRVEAPGENAGAPPRGYTEFFREAQQRVIRIALNKSANLSTFLHETGHVFLELLADLAERPDAPERVKEQWATTLKWLDIENRSQIEREHHEKWAKAFERYLMEGKAPSKKLEGAFARFKLWLRDIYRSVVNLGVELPDDIKGVFDRLLATDSEMQRTASRMGIDRPLARDVFGMSLEQYREYLDQREAALGHAERQAELTALKEQLREHEAWWKEELGKEVEAAQAAYEQLPGRQAKQFLRGRDPRSATPIALNRAAVEKAVGKEAAKRFQSRKEGGENPDDIAEALGYPTGKAMLDDIVELPNRERWVKDEAKARMGEKHGDVLQDRARLRDLVSKGLHGDMTLQVLTAELGALYTRAIVPDAQGRIDFQRPVDVEKMAAKKIADRTTLGRVDPSSALAAERSAAYATVRAAAAGDYGQAFILKRRQILNAQLWRELVDAREEREKFFELGAKLTSKAGQERLGKGRPIYRDGATAVLANFGLAEHLETPPAFSDVVQQLVADSVTVQFDEPVLQQLLARPIDWKDLSVSQMRHVVKALKAIEAGARRQSKVIVGKERWDIETAVGEAINEGEKNVPRGPPIREEIQKSGVEKVLSYGSAFDGFLTRIETMVHELAGGNLDSVWYRAFLDPMQEAKVLEADKLHELGKPIVEAFDKIPSKVRALLNQPLDGEKYFPNHAVKLDQDLATPSKVGQLVMMALNAGNDSNLARLLVGRNITLEQLQKAFDENLTKETWDWIQSVWDAHEAIWPELADLEERDSGVRPDKLELRSVHTPFGAYKGGYFQVLYVPHIEEAGARVQGRDLAALTDPTYTRAATAQSHLKQRVEGFTGAVSLEPSHLYRGLAQAIHDLAFRERLNSVGRLILHPEIQAELNRRLGPERASEWLKWAKDIGSARGMDGSSNAQKLFGAMRAIKANTALSVLGFSVPTALGDISNLVAVLPRTDLKMKHWAAGLAEFYNPLRTRQMIEETEGLSGELRTRRTQMRAELQRHVNAMTANTVFARGPLRWMRDHAFTFMEFTDLITSTPIWLGRYRQGLAEGLSADDAIRHADEVVRVSFPSHSVVDQAGVLRDKGFIGSSLFLHGYFNVVYNGNRQLITPILHMARRGELLSKDGAKVIAVATGTMMAFSAASLVLGELLSGRGPEAGDSDDDDPESKTLKWRNWFMRKMLLGWLSTVPGGTEISGKIEAKVLRKHSDPRKVGMMSLLWDLGDAALNATNADKELDKRVKALIRPIGAAAGVPGTSQAVRTGGYIWQQAQIQQGDLPLDLESRGPFDVAGGLTFGNSDSQPDNIPTLIQDAISGPR